MRLMVRHFCLFKVKKSARYRKWRAKAVQSQSLLYPYRAFGEYGAVCARSMSGRHIGEADRPIGTTVHAFLASLTCLLISDTRMAMIEKDYFPKNTVWTCLHTFPAGPTSSAVELNVFRARATP
jgi:hypothetical protein